MHRHLRTTRGAACWFGALLIALLPSAAHAHLDGNDTGLFNGLMHPVFGLDHLLAMVSVGVVSVQLGGNNIWRIPMAFVCAMTIGGALGIWRVTLLHVELGIAISVLVLGIGIVLAHRPMSPWPITGLVLLFGACHGYAWPRDTQVRQSDALHPRLHDQHFSAAHLRRRDRRGGDDAKVALDGIAVHRRRGGSLGRGVLVANVASAGLTAQKPPLTEFS